MPHAITVVIITKNAAPWLPACLDSIRFADEIMVVDSGSTDDTVTIAHRFGARVMVQTWLGYGPQKHFAVTQALHDWVLCLDADERVTDALQASIRAELAAPAFNAYEMPRRNRFLGRWLGHGEGYPDWCLRLFDRRHARWSDDAVHEKVITNQPVGRLRGDLLHESQVTIADYLAKQNQYTTLQAERLHAAGHRASILHLLVNPLVRFIKFYFVRRGFLDGIPGLIHILIGCANTFNKYAKLIERQRGKWPTA